MKGFQDALPYILKYEGGYSNHPADPGGATMQGITQKVYDQWRTSQKGLPDRPVLRITDEEIAEIYESNYWKPTGCDDLPWPISLVAFDTAVNQGPGMARAILKACEGMDIKTAPDAMIAIRRYVYRKLSEAKPDMKVFLMGWLNRLEALRRVWA